MRRVLIALIAILAPVLCFADPIGTPTCDEVCPMLPCVVPNCVARCNATDAPDNCWGYLYGSDGQITQQFLDCVCSYMSAPLDDDNTPDDDSDNDSGGDDTSPARHGGSSHQRSGCGVFAGNTDLLMFLFMTGIGLAALALGRRAEKKR